MTWTYRLVAALGILAISGLLPAWGDSKPAQAGMHATQQAAAPARHIHAVLRYDATTAWACRNFSDASSEVCLLLALHVIRMSEQQPAEAALRP